MAGIYIHIPYCKQLCHYCDFHKKLLSGEKDKLLRAIKKEILLQKEYLHNEEIETIYFGGGTPTVLSVEDISSLLDQVRNIHQIAKEAEITIEANPDDLTQEYLTNLKRTPVSRLSIGVQSFSDKELKLLHRRHSAEQAVFSVTMARDQGFNNISIDLMYGIPGTKTTQWETNLEEALKLNIQHISAYLLAIKNKTHFAKLLKKGEIISSDEEVSIEQFQLLIDRLEENGFLHYEISNFCKEGFFSRHNSNYWKQVKYLGLGPSAHSFNGRSRQWNISENTKYIASIESGKIPCKREQLDNRKRYNDYILVSLRTMWGIDMKYLEENFSKEARDFCFSLSKRFIEYGMLARKGENLILTRQGKFIADNIISELLMIE